MPRAIQIADLRDHMGKEGSPRPAEGERGGRAVVAAGQDPAGLKLGLQVMWAMSFWFERRPVGLSQSREW